MLYNSQKDFIRRHVGPSDNDQQKMLKELNFNNLDELINSTSWRITHMLRLVSQFVRRLVKGSA